MVVDHVEVVELVHFNHLIAHSTPMTNKGLNLGLLQVFIGDHIINRQQLDVLLRLGARALILWIANPFHVFMVKMQLVYGLTFQADRADVALNFALLQWRRIGHNGDASILRLNRLGTGKSAVLRVIEQFFATATSLQAGNAGEFSSRLYHVRLLNVLEKTVDADKQSVAVKALVILTRRVQHVLRLVVRPKAHLVLRHQDARLTAKTL